MFGRSLCLVIAMVWGCAFPIYETRQTVAIGYPEPPPVALVTIGDDPQLAGMVEQRLASARMRVVGRASIARSSELDASKICLAVARGEPAVAALANIPRDVARFVVIASADVMTKDHSDCANHDLVAGTGKFSWENPHKEGPSWDILPSIKCVEYEYDSSVSAAFAWTTVLDLETCNVVYEQKLHTGEAIARSGDRESNRAAAEKDARAAFAGSLADLGRDFFPRGLEVKPVQVASTHAPVEVTLRGDDAKELTRGARYRVNGTREKQQRDRIATLVVHDATPTTATARVEPYVGDDDQVIAPDLAILRVGDSIRSIKRPHNLVALPLVSVERMQEGDSQTVFGGNLALRWSYPRFWLYGEGIGTGAIGRNTLFTSLGLGLGVRIPVLVQLAPYAMGSIAGSRLRFSPKGGGDPVTETTPRPQLIGGVEIRIGRTVVLADVRYAWTSNLDADQMTTRGTRSWTVMFGLAGQARADD